MPAKRKTALIIGAGPAGLTAAYELLTRTDIHPIVIERDPDYVGGISRTVVYKGNRIDIGGHRFFSKSDRVMRWWANLLPVSAPESSDITYQRTTRSLTEGLKRATEADGDRVLQVRPRTTRILYRGDFYAYPVELSLDTLLKLGPVKVLRIGFTYMYATLFPRRPEKTLEDFFVNRFGQELYETFFKSYTEKVWGVPCTELTAEWGAQRVKGLSIRGAIVHALRKLFHLGALSGKGVETSLIEQFLYPAYGPGQMWETAVERILHMGGEVRMGTEVVGIERKGTSITNVVLADSDGRTERISPDYVFSTTDVRSLVRMLAPEAPSEVRRVAEGLEYRDFFTVGLLLSVPPTDRTGAAINDTWMYVHEPDVSVGRIQFFHNWNPLLVADPANGWIGLEYFAKEGDALWSRSDEELLALGKSEIEQLGLLGNASILDGTVLRQPKAYPGYFGSYEEFPVVRSFLDSLENLYAVGRNGMHRYNNQDHSMLAAMTAVDLIVEESAERERLWDINTEQEYHEEKS